MFILTLKNPAFFTMQIGSSFIGVNNLGKFSVLAREQGHSGDFKISKRQFICRLMDKISSPEQRLELKNLYNKFFKKDEYFLLDSNSEELEEISRD